MESMAISYNIYVPTYDDDGDRERSFVKKIQP